MQKMLIFPDGFTQIWMLCWNQLSVFLPGGKTPWRECRRFGRKEPPHINRCLCSGRRIPACVHMYTTPPSCACVFCFGPCASSRDGSWGFLQRAGPCDGHMQAPCAAPSCQQELVTALERLSPSLPSFSHPSLSTLPVQSSSCGCPPPPPALARPGSQTLQPKHTLYPAEITWTLVCSRHVRAALFSQNLV